MDKVLEVVQPALELCCRALLERESAVMSLKDLRDLLNELQKHLGSDLSDQAKGTLCMMALRKLIDRTVATNGAVRFLCDPLCLNLSKAHEGLKNYVATMVETVRPRGTQLATPRRGVA